MEKNIKRARAANYSQREKERLLNLITGYKSIIENKKTDGVSVLEKKKAWKEIEQKFNSVAPELNKRPMESLKKYYEKLKEDLRKRSGEEKKNIYMTGGGPSQKILDGDDDLLLSIVKEKSIFGLESKFDCDAEFAVLATGSASNKVTETVTAQKKIMPSPRVEFIFDDLIEIDGEVNLVQKEEQLEKIQERQIRETFYKEDWRKSTPNDLQKPLHPILKRRLSETYTPESSRSKARRPAVMPLTSSRLGEKYEQLVEKKCPKL